MMTQEKCIFDIMRLSQTCLIRILCIRINSIIFCISIRIICIVLFEIDVLYIYQPTKTNVAEIISITQLHSLHFRVQF